MINNHFARNPFSDFAKFTSVKSLFIKDERSKLEIGRPISILNCFSKKKDDLLHGQLKSYVDKSSSEFFTD